MAWHLFLLFYGFSPQFDSRDHAYDAIYPNKDVMFGGVC